jgi:hypothetical protein
VPRPLLVSRLSGFWSIMAAPRLLGLFVDAGIRQFCASANARLQACADFDAQRQFLADHVERVIYHRYKVTIAGSVPVQSASGETKLQFRIEGEIEQKGGTLTAANDAFRGWAVEGANGRNRSCRSL